MQNLSPTVYNDLTSLNRLKAQSAEKPQEALHEAARQFESLFVSMVIKAMRDTLPKDGMFSSNSMETYQQMFDQQLALDLSRRGGLGLSELIAEQLSAGFRPPDGEGQGQEAAEGSDNTDIAAARAPALQAYARNSASE